MDRIKQLFAGNSTSGSTKRKKKLFCLALFSFLLLAAAIIGIASTDRNSSSSSSENSGPATLKTPQSHTIIRNACSSTRFPELCFSAVAAAPGATKNITSQKDVIEASLNLTTTAVQRNFFTIEKLIASQGRSLTKRERTALHDCLKMIDDTLDELHKALEDLHQYPTKKSLQQHAGDLKTLMSAAMTNQETCLDGFSHDKADKRVRAAVVEGQVHVEKMCSNALAMIKNMTDTDMEIERRTMNRKLREERPTVDEAGWPEWLSAGDRRLLQSTTVTPNVVVAADGSGDHKTVAAAVAAAPEKSTKRYVIRIKAGVYRENVEVPKKKTNIMFIGDGQTKTIITGTRSVGGGSTTFHSATVDLHACNAEVRNPATISRN
ncbi:hypothetical protein CRG98_029183 [Punica granatum]|uniref:Pectinesterase n=1 Tax=Punica granatum TaxID=22663 RepID=A0A2I0J300_PUNGR|nr:hypothetical protein CRG98_029183 [Punica granatum]